MLFSNAAYIINIYTTFSAHIIVHVLPIILYKYKHAIDSDIADIIIIPYKGKLARL